jgi:bifunctional UDP-N-acetylglucosamine pyrophosphorylase/glucosamine-1-phosphate N-acetyltransferase
MKEPVPPASSPSPREGHQETLEALIASGVDVRDPQTTYVDAGVEVGEGTILYPGVILESGTVIGPDCTIHARVRITSCRLAEGVVVLDGSVLEDSAVAAGASIGPYARLRPGSEIGVGAKVGNFVETKATRLGAGSKASHLTYLGDAEIGENVNIGAGTITCNYDGVQKHRTIIEDGAFIGSNVALVAPVRIGAGAYVGAGSTITDDVPARALALGRGRQLNKEGWAERHSADKPERS